MHNITGYIINGYFIHSASILCVVEISVTSPYHPDIQITLKRCDLCDFYLKGSTLFVIVNLQYCFIVIEAAVRSFGLK